MSAALASAFASPAFMSFGFSELLLVGVVALLVFGGNLPDVMRTLGRSYGKLRRSLNEMSRPVREEIRKVRDLPSAKDLGSLPATDQEYADYEEPDPDVSTDPLPEQAVLPEAEGATGAADEPPPV
jgi:sec-independent protein translocase protein TatA